VGPARASGRPALVRRLSILLCLVIASLVPGCAGRRFAVPTGPAVPAPEAASAWDAATRACRDVRAATATLRLSARAGRCRIPSVRVGLALDGSRAVALTAQVGGTSLFRLAGPAEQATLFLRDGPRALRAPAADIVEALVGVKLDPARLLALLSGCLTPRPELVRGVRRDGLIEVTTPDSVAYLAEVDGAGWRLRAGTFEGLQVDYARQGPTSPREIQIRSLPSAAGAPISITISDLEIDPNPSLPTTLFDPPATAGAAPISLEELRATCPTGGARNEDATLLDTSPWPVL
jgi:hypothetical protein